MEMKLLNERIYTSIEYIALFTCLLNKWPKLHKSSTNAVPEDPPNETRGFFCCGFSYPWSTTLWKKSNGKFQEQFTSLKLHNALSSSEKSCTICSGCESPFCPVCPCCVHYLPVNHSGVVSVITLKIMVLQCLYPSNSPKAQEKWCWQFYSGMHDNLFYF